MKFKQIPDDGVAAGAEVYGTVTGNPYIYVGKDPINTGKHVAYSPRLHTYNSFDKGQLKAPVPSRTVWINVYTPGNAVWHTTEQSAKDKATAHHKTYIGTYELEIDGEV